MKQRRSGSLLRCPQHSGGNRGTSCSSSSSRLSHYYSSSPRHVWKVSSVPRKSFLRSFATVAPSWFTADPYADSLTLISHSRFGSIARVSSSSSSSSNSDRCTHFYESAKSQMTAAVRSMVRNGHCALLNHCVRSELQSKDTSLLIDSMRHDLFTEALSERVFMLHRSVFENHCSGVPLSWLRSRAVNFVKMGLIDDLTGFDHRLSELLNKDKSFSEDRVFHLSQVTGPYFAGHAANSQRKDSPSQSSSSSEAAPSVTIGDYPVECNMDRSGRLCWYFDSIRDEWMFLPGLFEPNIDFFRDGLTDFLSLRESMKNSSLLLESSNQLRNLKLEFFEQELWRFLSLYPSAGKRDTLVQQWRLFGMHSDKEMNESLERIVSQKHSEIEYDSVGDSFRSLERTPLSVRRKQHFNQLHSSMKDLRKETESRRRGLFIDTQSLDGRTSVIRNLWSQTLPMNARLFFQFDEMRKSMNLWFELAEQHSVHPPIVDDLRRTMVVCFEEYRNGQHSKRYLYDLVGSSSSNPKLPAPISAARKFWFSAVQSGLFDKGTLEEDKDFFRSHSGWIMSAWKVASEMNDVPWLISLLKVRVQNNVFVGYPTAFIDCIAAMNNETVSMMKTNNKWTQQSTKRFLRIVDDFTQVWPSIVHSEHLTYPLSDSPAFVATMRQLVVNWHDLFSPLIPADPSALSTSKDTSSEDSTPADSGSLSAMKKQNQYRQMLLDDALDRIKIPSICFQCVENYEGIRLRSTVKRSKQRSEEDDLSQSMKEFLRHFQSLSEMAIVKKQRQTAKKGPLLSEFLEEEAEQSASLHSSTDLMTVFSIDESPLASLKRAEFNHCLHSGNLGRCLELSSDMCEYLRTALRMNEEFIEDHKLQDSLVSLLMATLPKQDSLTVPSMKSSIPQTAGLESSRLWNQLSLRQYQTTAVLSNILELMTFVNDERSQRYFVDGFGDVLMSIADSQRSMPSVHSLLDEMITVRSELPMTRKCLDSYLESYRNYDSFVVSPELTIVALLRRFLPSGVIPNLNNAPHMKREPSQFDPSASFFLFEDRSQTEELHQSSQKHHSDPHGRVTEPVLNLQTYQSMLSLLQKYVSSHGFGKLQIAPTQNVLSRTSKNRNNEFYVYGNSDTSNDSVVQCATLLWRLMLWDNHIPDAADFNVMMDILCKCNEMTSALRLFESMVAAQIEPDSETLLVLADSVLTPEMIQLCIDASHQESTANTHLSHQHPNALSKHSFLEAVSRQSSAVWNASQPIGKELHKLCGFGRRAWVNLQKRYADAVHFGGFTGRQYWAQQQCRALGTAVMTNEDGSSPSSKFESMPVGSMFFGYCPRSPEIMAMALNRLEGCIAPVLAAQSKVALNRLIQEYVSESLPGYQGVFQVEHPLRMEMIAGICETKRKLGIQVSMEERTAYLLTKVKSLFVDHHFTALSDTDLTQILKLPLLSAMLKCSSLTPFVSSSNYVSPEHIADESKIKDETDGIIASEAQTSAEDVGHSYVLSDSSSVNRPFPSNLKIIASLSSEPAVESHHWWQSAHRSLNGSFCPQALDFPLVMRLGKYSRTVAFSQVVLLPLMNDTADASYYRSDESHSYFDSSTRVSPLMAEREYFRSLLDSCANLHSVLTVTRVFHSVMDGVSAFRVLSRINAELDGISHPCRADSLSIYEEWIRNEFNIRSLNKLFSRALQLLVWFDELDHCEDISQKSELRLFYDFHQFYCRLQMDNPDLKRVVFPFICNDIAQWKLGMPDLLQNCCLYLMSAEFKKGALLDSGLREYLPMRYLLTALDRRMDSHGFDKFVNGLMSDESSSALQTWIVTLLQLLCEMDQRIWDTLRGIPVNADKPNSISVARLLSYLAHRIVVHLSRYGIDSEGVMNNGSEVDMEQNLGRSEMLRCLIWLHRESPWLWSDVVSTDDWRREVNSADEESGTAKTKSEDSKKLVSVWQACRMQLDYLDIHECVSVLKHCSAHASLSAFQLQMIVYHCESLRSCFDELLAEEMVVLLSVISECFDLGDQRTDNLPLSMIVDLERIIAERILSKPELIDGEEVMMLDNTLHRLGLDTIHWQRCVKSYLESEQHSAPHWQRFYNQRRKEEAANKNDDWEDSLQWWK